MTAGADRRRGGRSALQLVAAVAGLWASAAPAQQVCDTSRYPLSSPVGQFDNPADGTVTDRQSGLMWQRCSAGQTASGSNCSGQVVPLTWPQARALAADVNQQGTFFFNDWRIPLLRELAALTERQCENPRINLVVFPGTPPVFYWTASVRPAAGLPAVSGGDFAYALSFGTAGTAYHDKQTAHLVRLVRSTR